MTDPVLCSIGLACVVFLAGVTWSEWLVARQKQQAVLEQIALDRYEQAAKEQFEHEERELQQRVRRRQIRRVK